MSNLEIDQRKIRAFDLMVQINRTLTKVKEWQEELARIDGEITELTEAETVKPIV